MVIPDTGNGASPAANIPAVNQKLVEMTPRGPVPKIAADGVRPAEAFARPVKPLPGKPDAPRIALIVSGLGVSANLTTDALTKSPAAVTLAFMPYGGDVERLVARARGEGHEILLQVPMEPFGYPDNDPGPQTSPDFAHARTKPRPALHCDEPFPGLCRHRGRDGCAVHSLRAGICPILHETAKRGLIFVDDGSNARSVAGRVAGATMCCSPGPT